MIPLILLVLLLTPAWSFAQETEEPSLAEVARKERERRASMSKPVRIITNANIKSIKGLVSGSTAPTPVAAEGEEGEGESGSENGERDLAAWQALFGEATLKLKTAVNRGRVLELKMNNLQNAWLRENDGVTQARIQQQLQETQQVIQDNQQEVQTARQALQALQGEAQLGGLLPGTLHEFVGELP